MGDFICEVHLTFQTKSPALVQWPSPAQPLRSHPQDAAKPRRIACGALRRGDDFQLVECPFLHDEDFLLADQFEQGEEDADHFAAALSADDQAAKRQISFAVEAVFDIGRVQIDRRVVVGDLVIAAACGRRLPSSAGRTPPAGPRPALLPDRPAAAHRLSPCSLAGKRGKRLSCCCC